MGYKKGLIILVLFVLIFTVSLTGCSILTDKNTDTTIPITSSKYTVTFDSNGGSEVASIETLPSLTISKPIDPTKEEFIFKGWYVDSAYTQEFDFNTKIIKDITLYAKWIPIIVTVTFHTNGGSEIAPLTLNRLQKIPFPNMPKKAGYIFKGWYLDKELTKEFNFSEVPENNIDLYALWEKINNGENVITLIGNEGHGTIVNSYNNKEGITLPNDWVKEGVEFGGWYENPDFTGESIKVIKPNSNRDFVLYAKWNPIQYTITLYDGLNQYKIYKIDKGQEQILPKLENKKGYNFLGWSLTCKADDIVTSIKAEGEEHINVYAVWKAVECTLQFDFQDGNEPFETYRDFGTNVILQNPTQQNYDFVGWYKSAEYRSSDRYSSSIIINETHMTFVAKWTPKDFTVKLYLDSNMVDSTNLIHTYGKSLALPMDLEKEGKKLLGWAMADGLEYVICHEIAANESGDLELFAVWENETYTINLDAQGSELSTNNYPTNYKYGSQVILPKAVKPGYDFVGWKDKRNGKIYNIITYEDFGNKNLIAEFKVKEYTLALYETDKKVRVSSVKYNDPITLQKITREGYEFIKWTLDKEGLQDVPQNMTMPMENLNLYAQYEAQKVIITFDMNGGKGQAPDAIEGFADDPIPQESIPNITGTKFLGWFTSKTEAPNGDVVYTLDKMPTKNITLYARWKGFYLLTPHNITYFDNEVKITNLEPTQYKTEIGCTLPIPVKEGYNFNGWYDNNAFVGNPIKYIYSDSVDDKVFYAKFTPKTALIKYVLTTNDNFIQKRHIYGTKTVLDTTITREGYELIGWYDNEQRTGVAVTEIDANNLEPKVFYAKWEKGNYTITLEGNGGKGSKNKLNYTYGETINLPIDWQRKGYAFVAWTYKENPKVQVSTITSTDFGDKVLVASWQAILYNVYLEGKGGTGSECGAYTYQEEKPLPMDWEKPGYDFMGWYMDPECLDEPNTVIPKDCIGAVTFFAKWSPKSYNITLVGIEDGVGTVIDKYYYGMYLELPTDWTREGYDFGGWYTQPSREAAYQIKEIDISSRGDIILYAKWIAKKYTLTYVTGTGQNIVQEYKCGETIVKPNNPIKETFVFAGWYLEEDCLNKFTKDIMPASNLTLYAKWDQGAVLTYVIDSKTSKEMKVVPGDSVTLINDIEHQTWNKPLYYFEGWFYDREFTLPCDNTIVMNKHISVYAKWTARGFMGYYDKFIPALSNSSYIINIESERELIAAMDFIMFNYVTAGVRLKIDYLGVVDEATIRDLIIEKVFKQWTTAAANSIHFRYLGNNTAEISVALSENGKDINIATQNPTIIPKVANGLVPINQSNRCGNYDSFKINQVEKEMHVETSDQLFYAAQSGLKPTFGTNSPAKRMYLKAKDILRNICDDEMTDFEKVYAIFTWFVQNIDYDHEAVKQANNVGGYMYQKHNNAEAWHMEGVFDKNLAVCDGMSKAFNLMCAIEGIPCIRVTGITPRGGHAWNKVYIDLDNNGIKEWYGVDVTWGSSDNGNNECLDNVEHMLFTDTFKSEKGATQYNQLDVVAKTDVDAYKYATYVDDRDGKIYDSVIENQIEMESIILEVSNNSKNRAGNIKVSLNIRITYAKGAQAMLDEADKAYKSILVKEKTLKVKLNSIYTDNNSNIVTLMFITN